MIDRKKGFTLLEILIALAIVSLMLTVIFFSLSKFNSYQALDKSADLVVSVLEEARSRTLSSVGASQYGVKLDEFEVTLFKGTTYAPADPDNMVTDLNTLVAIRDVVLAGSGTSVVFKRLTGSTDEVGTAQIYLKADPTIFRTITISSTGVVEWN